MGFYAIMINAKSNPSKEKRKMEKKSITITLSEETLKNLDELCQKYGLRKSQAISLAVNTMVLNEKGEKSDKK